MEEILQCIETLHRQVSSKFLRSISHAAFSDWWRALAE